MSLHSKIHSVNVFKNEEPSYEGYFNYNYMNDGTMKRFVDISRGKIAYEVGGKIPYGSITETSCMVICAPRTRIFTKRKSG